MGESTTRLQRRLPPHPASAGEARRMVRRLLADWGHDELIESAQLLVSEVVTNALVHAGTPIDVLVTVGSEGLRAEIGDGSARSPQRRSYGAGASTGRGLALIEQTADAWGVVPGVRGKTVWFHLTPAEASLVGAGAPANGVSTPGPPPVRPAPRAETRPVELQNVPLLLHTAWQQHADALLREYLLVTSDAHAAHSPPTEETPPSPPFAEHVAANDALALLAEHIPRAELGAEPAEVLRAGSEPHATRDSVRVPVPVPAVERFASLRRRLVAALQLADEDLFLTSGTQPELRSLRDWLCGQVATQAAGDAPVPWSAETGSAPPGRAAVVWDTSPVADAPDAQIAVDDTNRILAVSPALLELLGYSAREQLLGRRVVTIIPERYRQAHIAGFTLHQLTGRDPLLRTTVVVPARRHDGTEVVVDLTVEPQRVEDGRTVFVAHLHQHTG